jgi:hypothetical protein
MTSDHCHSSAGREGEMRVGAAAEHIADELGLARDVQVSAAFAEYRLI